MPEKVEDKRLNIRLDAETHRKLRLLAAETDTSIQQIVEAWVREKLSGAATPDSGSKGGACYA